VCKIHFLISTLPAGPSLVHTKMMKFSSTIAHTFYAHAESLSPMVRFEASKMIENDLEIAAHGSGNVHVILVWLKRVYKPCDPTATKTMRRTSVPVGSNPSMDKILMKSDFINICPC